MHPLSVVLITYNEEKNIARCLNSLKAVADEIIIVDSFSTDATEKICTEHAVKFYQNKFIDFSTQRNFALSKVTQPYALFIDADEVLSDALIQEILTTKKNGFEKEVYTINRLTNFCGKWIKHGMWYPDILQRLIKVGVGNWEGQVHESIQFTQPFTTGAFKGHLLHYSFASIESLVNKINKYTTMQAIDMHAKGKKAPFYKLYINPLWAFIHGYFFKLGLLDGWQGFLIHFSIAYQTLLKYTKLRQLYQQELN